jgi:uncharacterized caspase-like protein
VTDASRGIVRAEREAPARPPEDDAMERRALLVGIDHYLDGGVAPPLQGCVADATEMARLLGTHADGTPNFDCRLVCGTADRPPITRPMLRRRLAELFAGARGELLLYFAGHGTLTDTGGYLCTADTARDDWGVSMDEVLQLAGRCSASNVVLLLDCCHSGSFGNPGLLAAAGKGDNPLALLRENVTIMAASRDVQVAAESAGHGAFTRAMLDALSGGAADMLGLVTAPAVYAYTERRFGPWEQRPVYKSHATGVTVLRECAPAIERLQLRRMVQLFPASDHRYPLDPEYEPEDEHGHVTEPVNAEKVEIARLFKRYRDAGLLRASTAGEQLYWTARHSHTVELTDRGREYWWLVRNAKL